MNVKTALKRPLYISLKPFLDHHVLPRPVDWPAVFDPQTPRESVRLEVEIGCGNGEYVARLAQENPKVNYVAFEEYCERVSRTLRKLSRVASNNVRVLRLDVRPGFHYLFAPASIHFIHCLFPPPWPKKSDIKHRLLTTAFLRLCNSRLVEGGAMKIVTDNRPYALWLQEQIEGSGFTQQSTLVPARYGTKFERKWVQGGQKEFAEILLKKKDHADVPVKEDAVVQQYTIEHFDPENFRMEDFTDGKMAVVFRDFLYDPKRRTALVYVLVHDEHLLQNVRIVIAAENAGKGGNKGGWHVNLAQGTMLMPTPGIAKALECVRDAAQK